MQSDSNDNLLQMI